MGWMLKKGDRLKNELSELSSMGFPDQSVKSEDAPSVYFVENVEPGEAFRSVSSPISDQELPFIEAALVRESAQRGLHLIVIENVVYDCTTFVADHPGGPDILKPFKGSDCTWQFLRFHGREVLQNEARALRIGRTEGVGNKFKERPAYIGLRRLGSAHKW